MWVNVDYLIYTYLVVCALLVLYNVFYIFYKSAMEKAGQLRVKRLAPKIRLEMIRMPEAGGISGEHTRMLERKMKNTNWLLSYANALDSIKEDRFFVLKHLYYKECAPLYWKIAAEYAKKDVMDRAFAANFIAMHTPVFYDEHKQIYDILTGFLYDSSIYCRENVLKAMYAFGNTQAVWNAIMFLEENGTPHNRKLLSDGLATFRGDRKELAGLLWEHKERLSEGTLIAVIEFITRFTEGFESTFFYALLYDNPSMEEKIAYIRYFGRHPYAEAGDYLKKTARERSREEEDVCIVAVSSLAAYPDEETILILADCIKSKSWYIRLNAAKSLVKICGDRASLEDIAGNDRYASEILEYVMEKEAM